MHQYHKFGVIIPLQLVFIIPIFGSFDGFSKYHYYWYCNYQELTVIGIIIPTLVVRITTVPLCWCSYSQRFLGMYCTYFLKYETHFCGLGTCHIYVLKYETHISYI